MLKELTVTKAIRNFSDIIGRIRYRGESFLLTKGGTAVARIGPVDRGIKAKELAPLWKEIKHLSPESAKDFSKDLANSRLILKEVEDKWAS